MPELKSYFDFTQYVTMSDAAEILGCTRDWVHKLSRVEIDYIVTPLGRLYDRSKLNIWRLERDLYRVKTGKRYYKKPVDPDKPAEKDLKESYERASGAKPRDEVVAEVY